MKQFRTGVMAGKFWPLHAGHQFVIETALAQCEQVYLLACWNPRQDLSVTRRLLWLRELYPQTLVLSVLDVPADDDSRGWAHYTEEILGFKPEAVFSSESYGDEYARYLGAAHVCVDPMRQRFRCSGTQIREAPLSHLSFLSPCVRAHYIKRVCIVGAESTGKTTMAEALAAHYRTVWMPEYAREYWDQKFAAGTTQHWASEEFVHIAREHARREDTLARHADRVLVVDTDALATGIWHRRYMNDARCAAVERLATERQQLYALYLLCDTDIPWIQDGTRDGQHIRCWMHDALVHELDAASLPWVLLSGTHAERLNRAIGAIDRYLGWAREESVLRTIAN